MAGVGAQPFEFELGADGAQFLRHPAVQGGGRQCVRGLPAFGAVLERNRRVERPEFQARSPVTERIRVQLQIGLGQVHRVAVMLTPCRSIDLQGQQIPEILRHREARATQFDTVAVTAIPQYPEAPVDEGGRRVRSHQPHVE